MRDERRASRHAGNGDVVLRVVGPFPDVQRGRCVQDELPGKITPDSSRYRSDVIGLGDHSRERGYVVHLSSPLGSDE
jgi:hypothetical protein